jgi:hypothetical protein
VEPVAAAAAAAAYYHYYDDEDHYGDDQWEYNQDESRWVLNDHSHHQQPKLTTSLYHNSYSIIVSAHAGLDDAFEATRPELFTTTLTLSSSLQDIVLCHKLGFAHCDVRRPNIVYHSRCMVKMSLVDREYHHSRYTRLSDSTATREEKPAIVDNNIAQMYESLRTYQYFDFFARCC